MNSNAQQRIEHDIEDTRNKLRDETDDEMVENFLLGKLQGLREALEFVRQDV